MQSVFEKIKDRLEELIEETYYKAVDGDMEAGIKNMAYHRAKGIINQVAKEYNNGWIPCSERLPDEYCHCLVTRRNDYDGGCFDGDVREDVYIELEGVWGWRSQFEGLIDNIIAWQPLPAPYPPKGE